VILSIIASLGGTSKRYPAPPQKAIHRDRVDPGDTSGSTDVAAVLGEQVDEESALQGREPLLAERT